MKVGGLVATATYNEAANINEWYERTRTVLPEIDLLVVDDSSPDGTAEIVRELQSRDPNLHLLTRPAKSGLGSAHRAAMLFALEGSYSFLVTMDADLSHHPEQIPRLIQHLDTHDFVIGTRSAGGSCDYTGMRRFLSTGGNRAARILIPTGLTEYTTSLRAFSPIALEALFTNGIRDDGYAFFMECVESLHRAKHRLGEVPIHFSDRTRGHSKIPRHQILISVSTLLRLSAGRLVARRKR
jgi:dolichol-phosphate mannosyltransferase